MKYQYVTIKCAQFYIIMLLIINSSLIILYSSLYFYYYYNYVKGMRDVREFKRWLRKTSIFIGYTLFYLLLFFYNFLFISIILNLLLIIL